MPDLIKKFFSEAYRTRTFADWAISDKVKEAVKMTKLRRNMARRPKLDAWEAYLSRS